MAPPKGKRRVRRPATKAYVDRAISRIEEKKMKYENIASSLNSVGTTWVEVDMTDIDVGDSLGHRDGAKILLKSINIQGILQTGDDTNAIRLVVALWDGRTATPLTTNGATISSPAYKDTLTGDGLIKKYLDKYIAIEAAITTEYGQRVFGFYKKWKKGIPIIYTGDGTTANKKLIVSMISDSVAVSHPGFGFGYASVRYTDS